MAVEIVGEVTAVRVIATGRSIRQLGELREAYGEGRWRKLKGIAIVRRPDGHLRRAEVHWNDAHGIGRRRLKVKRFLD